MITGSLFPTQVLLGRMGAKSITMMDFSSIYVDMDAVVKEDHQFDVDVTEYPIENGDTINDHVVIKPIVLSIEGVVSNSPIYVGSGFLDINRVMDAHGLFVAMNRAGSLLTIVSGLKIYDNMVMGTYHVSREAKNGQALEFSMTLKQMNIVVSQTGNINSSNPRTGKRNQSTVTSKSATTTRDVTNKVASFK